MTDPLALDAEPRPPALGYGALFVRFLRFGALAFGGPVAQIALIRRELVDEERWIGSDRFNRLVAVMQALPGPEAHELCVHLGMRAKGRLGGLLAGLGFMLPGFVLMLVLGWAYTSIAAGVAVLASLFAGVQAAVVAVIARAVHRIGEHILVDRWLWVTAAAVAAASLAGAPFWIALPAAGLFYPLARDRRPAAAAIVAAAAAALALLVGDASAATMAAAATPTTLALFSAGLKGGLLTFGGAYTAIPFVRGDAIGKGWMSDAQFLDGLGLSGIIPAPLVIFATFVGWVAGGLPGALATTVGMFLPAFAFSLLFFERLESIIEHPRLQHALAGVAAGVVGLIAVTTVDLARAALRSPAPLVSLAIAAVALVVAYRWRSKLAPPAAIAFGGAAGAALL